MQQLWRYKLKKQPNYTFKCVICNEIKNNNRSIHDHLKKKHNKTIKEYYDCFLKKESEGICTICNNSATFINSKIGYKKTCNQQECVSAQLKITRSSTKYKEKMSKISKRNWRENFAFRSKMSKQMTDMNNKNWASPVFRSKRSKSVSYQMKNLWKLVSFRERHSKMMHDLWNNIEYINRLKEKGWTIPEINTKEKIVLEILNELFPQKFKFVGDYSIMIKRKNPDFISVDGSKLIVEHLGDYWHKDDTEEILDKRQDIFKSEGYKTLFVWEHELNDVNALKTKITSFVKGPNI